MNLTPTTPVDDDNTEPGPFIELSRESWAALSDSTEIDIDEATLDHIRGCLLYTSPSPRDRTRSRMPSSA